VHSASSTTYPLTIMESWNVGCEVLGAWAKPPNINWAHCAPPLTAGHEPNPTLAALHLWLSGLKIWLAATLLRCVCVCVCLVARGFWGVDVSALWGRDGVCSLAQAQRVTRQHSICHTQ
jgi:hypothetical protein